jgi:hypothetical protein
MTSFWIISLKWRIISYVGTYVMNINKEISLFIWSIYFTDYGLLTCILMRYSIFPLT